MRKITLYMLAIFSMIALLSCEKEDPALENIAMEGTMVESSYTFTSLDTYTDVELTFSNVKTTSVAITLDDGTSVFNGALVSLVASFKVTEAQYVANEDDGDLVFNIAATVDGNVVKTTRSISRKSSLSFSISDYKFGVLEQSNVKNYILYSFNKGGESVLASLTTQYKIGENGTYAALANSFDVATAKDSLYVQGMNYTVGDTVYVKLTAAAAVNSLSKEVSFVVGKHMINDSESFDLDALTTIDDLKGFRLDTLGKVLLTASNCHIKFAGDKTTVGGNQGFEGLNGVKFVDITSVGSTSDLVALKALYDAGTPVSVVANTYVGNIYVTYFTADTKNYVGVLTVTAKNGSVDPEENHVEFDYSVTEYDLNK